MKKYAVFLALYTILIGLSVFFFKNLGQTQIPEVKAATSDFGTITITNTGSEKTDYDVLVPVDTATQISAGKMQSDCDDIRLKDSDHSTDLDYWIESGCNTATTQIWVTVPTVPNGTKDIFIDYNDPAMANGEQSSGNFILFNTSSCSGNWAFNSSMDNRFPYGASSYGGTGGVSTHNHEGTKNINSSNPSHNRTCRDGPNGSHSWHLHPISLTINSASNLPTYKNIIPCQDDDLTIPAGYVALFDAAVPSGWTRFSSLDNYLVRGDATYNTTGGSGSHTHSVTNSSSDNTARSGSYGNSYFISNPNHSHTFPSVNSSSSNHTPPYRNMIFGSKDSAGIASPDMIVMASAVPPIGWTRFTALDNKFPRGSSSYGGTSGNTTHSHSASGTSGGPDGSFKYCQTGDPDPRGISSDTHTHTWSTSTNSDSHLPPYLNTIFAKRQDPVGNGVTTSIQFTPPPTAPTIGTATVISDTSIQWNFTDNADDETGFKVYDGDTLKATCATANLSSCTETGLTANTEYTRKVVAYNDGGNSAYSSTDTATTNKTSCQPDLTDTTHVITGDCSFSVSRGTGADGKTIYGMDPANASNNSTLTIAGGTLTVTSAEHLITGSLNMTGGSVSIATGGKITPGGAIYYADTDADGYPSSTVPQIAITPPANHRRRHLMTSTVATDCNDSNGTFYQNLTGYTDSDGDGYGTGGGGDVCSGAALPSGYANNNTDCDDNANSGTNTCQACTGGTETTSGGDRIHTFTSSGTLVCSSSTSANYLVVGGGGGGGGSKSGWGGTGGGGGGGVQTGSTSLSSTSYGVTVGAGGAAGGECQSGWNGGNSIFNGINSGGGGGGGGYNSCSPDARDGEATGGSGGGGAGYNNGQGYGNSGGGHGARADTNPGGAGGGGAAPQDGVTHDSGGAGGDGKSSNISGSTLYYGGGGSTGYSSGSGSQGGGGWNYYGGGGHPNGYTNTGGGGSGTYGSKNGGYGGTGGSGIVIIRYTE